MAKPKPIPVFDLEASLPSLTAAVKARGLLKKTELKALGVPNAFQAEVLRRLEQEGFEVAKSGVRVPLSVQLLNLVQERGVVAWPPGKLLKGGTPKEYKASAMALARAGELQLLVRGKVEAVTGPGTPAVSREELRSLGQLAVSVQKALKSKPMPRTLLRADVRELLLDLLQPVGAEQGAPRPAAAASLVDRLVLEAAGRRDPQSGLCSVPDLVLALLPAHSLSVLHEALLQAVRERRLELRPESGVDRLSNLELALCPVGLQETRLSWARPLGTEA